MAENQGTSFAVEELITLSHKYGISAAHVQGGGGNTSIKLDNEEMLIKASGHFLSEMTPTSGYLKLRHNSFIDLLANENSTQKDYDCLLAESADRSGAKELRPSMETGFHAILGKVVLHSHSVYSNLINCSKNYSDLFHKTFPREENIHLLSYLNPGFELSRALYKASQVKTSKLNTYFLQNHGIVVEGESIEDVLHEYERVHQMLEKACTPIYKFQWKKPIKVADHYESVSPILLKYMNSQTEHAFEPILFPDQSVYTKGMITSDNKEKKKIVLDAAKLSYHCTEREAIAIDQTLAAYAFIFLNIEALGQKHHPVSERDTDIILNLSSEKFRKEQL